MEINKIQLIGCLFLLFGITSCSKYKRELDVDWKRLNSKEYTIRYLQHNFDPFLNDSTMYLKVVDFAESPNLVTLDSIDVVSLVQLISDSTNFSHGECGTFALNAGIIVFHEESINGIVSIGCGYSQWEFEPFNPNCRYGGLNEKGFELMTKMLDEINIKNEKLK
jgi:hypothetical protein